jgi:ATP-dependent phosphofructokinase / diphosphate-dependent phosphofructokinase
MRIGLLTGGGDAPGLNGILEAATRVLFQGGHEIIGIEDGFAGVFENRHRVITPAMVENLHTQAGTLLGTTNKMGTEGREAEFLERWKALKLDGMIVAGGDGTFAGLKPFRREIPIVGVPKTIDNDLSGTELTFGYDTACSVVADSVDALRATAEAHSRLIVVETMGRTAGWIALGGGIASFAEVVLLPERPFSRPALLEFLRKKKASGKRGLVVVVSEGAKATGEGARVAFTVEGSPQAERYGGIAMELSRWLESELHWEARPVVLGHLQRARPPTGTDRFLTLAMGVEAGRMAAERAWGHACVYRGGSVSRAPLDELMGPARLVPDGHRWVELLRAMGSFI